MFKGAPVNTVCAREICNVTNLQQRSTDETPDKTWPHIAVGCWTRLGGFPTTHSYLSSFLCFTGEKNITDRHEANNKCAVIKDGMSDGSLPQCIFFQVFDVEGDKMTPRRLYSPNRSNKNLNPVTFQNSA